MVEKDGGITKDLPTIVWRLKMLKSKQLQHKIDVITINIIVINNNFLSMSNFLSNNQQS